MENSNLNWVQVNIELVLYLTSHYVTFITIIAIVSLK